MPRPARNTLVCKLSWLSANWVCFKHAVRELFKPLCVLHFTSFWRSFELLSFMSWRFSQSNSIFILLERDLRFKLSKTAGAQLKIGCLSSRNGATVCKACRSRSEGDRQFRMPGKWAKLCETREKAKYENQRGLTRNRQAFSTHWGRNARYKKSNRVPSKKPARRESIEIRSDYASCEKRWSICGFVFA